MLCLATYLKKDLYQFFLFKFAKYLFLIIDGDRGAGIFCYCLFYPFNCVLVSLFPLKIFRVSLRIWC